jgi:drug/metabolite transporter (DMT)-like permease
VGYYTLLRVVPVTTLNLMSYVYPVVAVGLGYLVLGEVLDGFALAGAGLVLAGIAIATWRRRSGQRRGRGPGKPLVVSPDRR